MKITNIKIGHRLNISFALAIAMLLARAGQKDEAGTLLVCRPDPDLHRLPRQFWKKTGRAASSVNRTTDFPAAI